MLEHTKKHPTKKKQHVIRMVHAGRIYEFPKSVADKYKISEQPTNADELFESINKQYTKPGALLRGIRIRENLTQSAMAKLINVTQSDISQMERGTRAIGRNIAKRIESIFDVSYHSFLR